MKQKNKQYHLSLLAFMLMLVMVVSLIPGVVNAEDFISNAINPLIPVVTQNGVKLSPVPDSAPAIYEISANKENVYLDYIASMDLTHMASSFNITWQEVVDAISANPNNLDSIISVTVNLEFQLDEHLTLVEADWQNAKFESSFFSVVPTATTVDNDSKQVTMQFVWDSAKAKQAVTDNTLSPIIILKGVPMLVDNDWEGDSLELTNSGTVSGEAVIKYNNIDLQVPIGSHDINTDNTVPITQSNTIKLNIPATPNPPTPAPATVVEPTEPPVESATLCFDPNGGTWPSGSTEPMIMYAAVGDMVRLPLAPSKEGANFVYWEGSRYNPGELYEVTGDHKFTAHFEDYSSAFAGTAGKPVDTQQEAPVGNQNLVTDLPKTGEQSTAPAVIASLAGLSILIVLRKKISK